MVMRHWMVFAPAETNEVDSIHDVPLGIVLRRRTPSRPIRHRSQPSTLIRPKGILAIRRELFPWTESPKFLANTFPNGTLPVCQEDSGNHCYCCIEMVPEAPEGV